MAAKTNEQYKHVEDQLQASHILPMEFITADCSREVKRQHPHYGPTNTAHCTAQMQSAIHWPP